MDLRSSRSRLGTQMHVGLASATVSILLLIAAVAPGSASVSAYGIQY